jgi:hypothetical protein
VRFAAVILLAVTCTASTDIWLAFARRSLRRVFVLTLAGILCNLIGVAVFRFGRAPRLGLEFILIPTALAFAVIALRPLQFPVVPYLRRGER